MRVSSCLQRLWSPQEIAARLRLDQPEDPEMSVSHQTIYYLLFIQGRGELLRNWPAAYDQDGQHVRRAEPPMVAVESGA